MGLGQFVGKFSHTGRKLARQQRSFEKAQQNARIADIESEMAFRTTEDPRERSALKQSMFGRGLGKSTIATQGQARLGDIQSRRNAALERQKDLAHRGLSLIKLRARAARRLLPFEISDVLTATAGQIFGGPGWKPSGDSGATADTVYELE